MPTKFEEIYGRALFKFTDYSFINTCTDLKEAVLQKYLLSSIVDFQHSCKVDLNDYDLEKEQVKQDYRDTFAWYSVPLVERSGVEQTAPEEYDSQQRLHIVFSRKLAKRNKNATRRDRKRIQRSHQHVLF